MRRRRAVRSDLRGEVRRGLVASARADQERRRRLDGGGALAAAPTDEELVGVDLVAALDGGEVVEVPASALPIELRPVGVDRVRLGPGDAIVPLFPVTFREAHDGSVSTVLTTIADSDGGPETITAAEAEERYPRRYARVVQYSRKFGLSRNHRDW